MELALAAFREILMARRLERRDIENSPEPIPGS